MELLLLADPSEEKVRAYLPASRCFVVLNDGVVVGVCAVQQKEAGVHELMNIAVRPEQQQLGVGSRLLKWVIEIYRAAGARALEVGTGSFGYQLTFYQRHGFRVAEIDRDFFVTHYGEPIFEEGIRLRDMLRLRIEYRS
ncbi:N-acetyltransferase [Paraburkholderia pallida]|uniref:N-acetyltransferase n=1 Tax=Paraburkholderia pallida TaxID=2547399 RepID=A0A4P7D623_9BURK|nr:N-acetyltransferase [Paraburkholderia pallida]